MKAQLETITNKLDRSFSMMFNPRLSDLFFWHSHPEYELVYIKAPSGTRHVGDHISTYTDYDLVLIGSNIPHLNFDYGLRTEYEKVVVHLKKEFVEQHLAHTPEMRGIQEMFKASQHGLAFRSVQAARIADALFELEGLDGFEQYLKLIQCLHELAKEQDRERLHPSPYLNKSRNKEQERLRLVHAYIDKNYQRKIELEDLAQACSMTKEAFCRYFKKMTQYTFVDFLNRYRISQSKRYLMSGASVSEACFESGFQSLSYFNRIFKKVTSENPSQFRSRYLFSEKS